MRSPSEEHVKKVREPKYIPGLQHVGRRGYANKLVFLGRSNPTAREKSLTAHIQTQFPLDRKAIMRNDTTMTSREGWTMKRTLLLTVHWIIILNFIIEIAYAGYMVFTVLRPESGGGPLFEKALTLPFEHMTTRRLYAIECWIAIAGLAIYLAITEIGPRLREGKRQSASSE